jgi:predicted ATPase
MALREQQETTRQILALAQQHASAERWSIAHRVSGVFCETTGELLSAREHFEQAVALYDPEQHASTAFAFGHDIGVAALSHLIWVLWLLGYPDQSSRRDAETLALAHRLDHKHSLAFGLWYSAIADVFRRDTARAAERSAALLQLGQQQGFGLWTPGATVIQGWAMTREGQGAAGVEWIRRGIAEWTSVGAEMARPFFFGLFAEAYALGGELQRGLGALDKGIAAVERTGQRWPEAELYRLRGELLTSLADDGAEEAEAAFGRAIEVARRQYAKSWELRAATSLARLWRDHGKRAEARDLLAPVYGWFTEGFATPDLKHAKALLDELA